MKSKVQSFVFAVSCVLALSFLILGCGMTHPKPQFETGEKISTTATVEAIDYQSRVVTLKGPQGNLVNISVNDEAYNFNQVVVGDLVDITYSRSVAVYLQKTTGETSEVSGRGLVRAPKGQKPDDTISNSIEIKAKVENIDYANRIVDIRGPHGKLIQVEVDETVKNFDNIQKGDDVVVRYIEAVAISVHPAASPASE
jgi:hypothetical protein